MAKGYRKVTRHYKLSGKVDIRFKANGEKGNGLDEHIQAILALDAIGRTFDIAMNSSFKCDSYNVDSKDEAGYKAAGFDMTGATLSASATGKYDEECWKLLDRFEMTLRGKGEASIVGPEVEFYPDGQLKLTLEREEAADLVEEEPEADDIGAGVNALS